MLHLMTIIYHNPVPFIPRPAITYVHHLPPVLHACYRFIVR